MKKWNIGWGISSKCNMNCQFCYSKENRRNSLDITIADWKSFVDENNEKITSINYGTGENTLIDDWFDLILYIREKYPHIRQALTTNGYLSEACKDSYKLEAFIKAIDEVDVSLDFAEEESHCLFRGQSKAYRWAIDTLKLCKEYGKRTTIVFIGAEKNLYIKNIDGLFAIAKQYNAILRMNIYRPTEGINERSKQFIASQKTIIDTLEYISNKYHILSIGDSFFSPILCGTKRKDPSGDKSIRILANGNITPSTYLIDDKYVVSNIKRSNVLTLLEDGKVADYLIKNCTPEECKGCVYADDCEGGVIDRRYLWYGTLNKRDPYCPGPFKQKNKIRVVLSDEHFESVHDDYLPTMFFKP